MDQVAIPSKEQVRDWLRSRRTERSPLPSLERIQRDVGWKASVVANDAADGAYCRLTALPQAA